MITRFFLIITFYHLQIHNLGQTSANYNKTPLSPELEALHKHIKTTAYVVIKNDSVIQENYWIDGDTAVISNSFSIAKSYVSMLIGFAIQDKYIRSVDQPIGDFLPYFRSEGKEKITIKHLLQMSSGLSWDESYTGPLSITTQGYYGNDLEKLIKGLKVISEPGKEFRYLSGDTQLLGLVLKKATGYSLSEYLYLKFWNPVALKIKHFGAPITSMVGKKHFVVSALRQKIMQELASCI